MPFIPPRQGSRTMNEAQWESTGLWEERAQRSKYLQGKYLKSEWPLVSVFNFANEKEVQCGRETKAEGAVLIP